MATTPAVSRRRLSQFYIDVPPSPVALSEYKPLASYAANHNQRVFANLKENMPALPLHASLKRKSSLKGDVPPVKKFKQQRHSTHAEAEDNLTNGHPNEYIYCHQCLKKRDIMGANIASRKHVI